MKSSKADLDRRGYLSSSEFEQMNSNHNVSNINDKSAKQRTYAIRYLRKENKKSFAKSCIELLKSEKALYTKIEICEYLAECGESVVLDLIPLLGKIGSNQHKEIANIDNKKKGYPLPRDIIARILIRIGKSTLPYLSKLLENTDDSVVSEAIDVIGHISYYENDKSCGEELIKLYKSTSSELIKWKCIRSFRALNTSKVIDMLNEIMINENSIVLRNEAGVSYNIICTKGIA